MLRTVELSMKYTQRDEEIFALKDVTFEAKRGEFINITGRSGSGKTTLLNLIAGLLTPTSGEIIWNEKKISNLSDEEASFFRNNNIGYIMQGNSALSNLTVLENISFPYLLYQRDGDVTERAENLLKQVGIYKLKDSYPSKLSGGELKRMGIARALINNPPILLADEPTGDLDSENTECIMKLFRQIADKGTTVLAVTHELDTLSYGDRVYEISGGVLKAV